MIQRLLRWMVIASLLAFGLAMAQSEPTLKEVYAAAQAGRLDQAQVMMQQVLVVHPKSAKAHFVQSELFARQGNPARGREALATAEKLAPGLPFAKPEAVQSLRAQLSAGNAPVSHSVAAKPVAATVSPAAGPSSTASASPTSWGLPLLLAGAVMVLGYFMFRKKASLPYADRPAQPVQPAWGGGLSGPQTFGAGTGQAMPAPYGQPAYGQPAGSGLGGKIMGGVATGLAVGAGMMAAEAIGKTLTGHHDTPTRLPDNFPSADSVTQAVNSDMGGQDFGVNDAASWDNAGGVDGGGDWDNS